MCLYKNYCKTNGLETKVKSFSISNRLKISATQTSTNESIWKLNMSTAGMYRIVTYYITKALIDSNKAPFTKAFYNSPENLFLRSIRMYGIFVL